MRSQEEEFLEGCIRFARIVYRLLQFRGLLDERKTHLFGTGRESLNTTRLRASLVQFRLLRPIRRR